MRFLGVDFGEKKIGLAISEGFLAEPLGAVKKVAAVQRICAQQGIDKIVIGLAEAAMALKTKRFGKQLTQLTGLPVVYEDETLTSQEAKKIMVKSGKPKKKRQRQTHTIAACLILQNYLDKQG